MLLLLGSRKCQRRTCKLNHVIMLSSGYVMHLSLFDIFVSIYKERKDNIIQRRKKNMEMNRQDVFYPMEVGGLFS